MILLTLRTAAGIITLTLDSFELLDEYLNIAYDGQIGEILSFVML